MRPSPSLRSDRIPLQPRKRGLSPVPQVASHRTHRPCPPKPHGPPSLTNHVSDSGPAPLTQPLLREGVRCATAPYRPSRAGRTARPTRSLWRASPLGAPLPCVVATAFLEALFPHRALLPAAVPGGPVQPCLAGFVELPAREIKTPHSPFPRAGECPDGIPHTARDGPIITRAGFRVAVSARRVQEPAPELRSGKRRPVNKRAVVRVHRGCLAGPALRAVIQRANEPGAPTRAGPGQPGPGFSFHRVPARRSLTGHRHSQTT